MARLFIAATLMLSTALDYLMLTNGHDWGDDFAQYLLQARSIADGTTQDFVEYNRFTIENTTEMIGPYVYPWGCPWCLAAVCSVFGFDLIALKCVNLLFFDLALLCVYALFVRRIGRPAACLLLAMLAFNPNLLKFHNNLLSDTPFMFFSVFSLYLIDKFILHAEYLVARWISYVLLGASVFAAISVRGNGVLLLPTIFLCQVVETARSRPSMFIWRRFPVGTLPYIVCGALQWITTSPFLPDGSAIHMASGHFSWWRVGDNAIFYLGQLSNLFGIRPQQEILLALSLPLLYLGIKARWRQEYCWLAFCAANQVLYTVLPSRGSMRYLLPMMPFYLCFMYQGAMVLGARLFPAARQSGNDLVGRAPFWPRAGFALAATLAASFLGESGYFAYENLHNERRQVGPYDEDSTNMFDHVIRCTARDAKLLFFKPRAMRLLTGRRAFASNRPQDLAKADYLVVHKKLDPCNQVRQPGSDAVEHVFENSTFVIYRLRTAN